MASPPTLHYRPERRPDRKLHRLHYALCLYPLALLAALHGLYLMEWVQNSERPIPPHHGADNWPETFIYWLTHTLFLCAVPAFMVHVFVAAWVAQGLLRQEGEDSGSPASIFLQALAAWVGAFLLFAFDPFRAIYFFLD